MIGTPAKVFVGVTGAHNVGKTTLCARLDKHLREVLQIPVATLDGLGDRMRSLGVPLGRDANGDTVAAIYAAQLEREANAPPGMIILDRCVVDALAYVRSLKVNTPPEMELYERVTELASKRLDLVIHLTLSPFFSQMCGDHETPELRIEVARAIPQIVDHLGINHIVLDASTDDAIKIAVDAAIKVSGLSRPD